MNIHEHITELERVRIEKEMKREEDKLYTRLLVTFGLLTLFIASIAILINDLHTTKGNIALFLTAFVLTVMGSGWHYYDTIRVKKVEEQLEMLRQDEFQGVRVA